MELVIGEKYEIVLNNEKVEFIVEELVKDKDGVHIKFISPKISYSAVKLSSIENNITLNKL